MSYQYPSGNHGYPQQDAYQQQYGGDYNYNQQYQQPYQQPYEQQQQQQQPYDQYAQQQQYDQYGQPVSTGTAAAASADTSFLDGMSVDDLFNRPDGDIGNGFQLVTGADGSRKLINANEGIEYSEADLRVEEDAEITARGGAGSGEGTRGMKTNLAVVAGVGLLGVLLYKMNKKSEQKKQQATFYNPPPQQRPPQQQYRPPPPPPQPQQHHQPYPSQQQQHGGTYMTQTTTSTFYANAQSSSKPLNVPAA
ncbi:hypothetical protein GQ42DRAFT_181094 [Ramicandelaber brevisporus]|nr:hypothetical protein GQ42DRAFT_181094 [Ramicandelaber brevisporus]